MNSHTIKTKFLNANKKIISENLYFAPGLNIGAYIKTGNIDLIKLLAVATAFKINLPQMISMNYDSQQRATKYELYKLCWPFVILYDSRPANLTEYDINSTPGESTKYLINNHLDYIVDAKDNEIIHLRFSNYRLYASFDERIINEVYGFINQCSQFIG